MGRNFPCSWCIHCGSFSQVGWNDGVLVVSETQIFSASTGCKLPFKPFILPNRSLLYMCVDIQYEWDGFASCRRPIHKWLLLSYGLVVMSRLVHVAGALMPFSCKWRSSHSSRKLPATKVAVIWVIRSQNDSEFMSLPWSNWQKNSKQLQELVNEHVITWDLCSVSLVLPSFLPCEVKPSPEKHCSTITPFSDVAGGETSNFCTGMCLLLMF